MRLGDSESDLRSSDLIWTTKVVPLQWTKELGFFILFNESVASGHSYRMISIILNFNYVNL